MFNESKRTIYAYSLMPRITEIGLFWSTYSSQTVQYNNISLILRNGMPDHTIIDFSNSVHLIVGIAYWKSKRATLKRMYRFHQHEQGFEIFIFNLLILWCCTLVVWVFPEILITFAGQNTYIYTQVMAAFTPFYYITHLFPSIRATNCEARMPNRWTLPLSLAKTPNAINNECPNSIYTNKGNTACPGVP